MRLRRSQHWCIRNIRARNCYNLERLWGNAVPLIDELGSDFVLKNWEGFVAKARAFYFFLMPFIRVSPFSSRDARQILSVD